MQRGSKGIAKSVDRDIDDKDAKRWSGVFELHDLERRLGVTP